MSEHTPKGGSSKQGAAKGSRLATVIRPITRTIRTKTASVVLFLATLSAGALGYHFWNNNQKAKELQRLNSEASCLAYFEESKNDIFGCPPCNQACERIIACAEAKRSRSRDTLEQYLEKYEDTREDDPCYVEIEALLDSVTCEQILAHPENIVYNCRAYMEEFGLAGVCYNKCFSVLDSADCDAARRAKDKASAYRSYLETYDPVGLCCDDFKKEILICRSLLDSIENETCQDFVNYFIQNEFDGYCSQRALVLLQNRFDISIDTSATREKVTLCVERNRKPGYSQENIKQIRRNCFDYFLSASCYPTESGGPRDRIPSIDTVGIIMGRPVGPISPGTTPASGSRVCQNRPAGGRMVRAIEIGPLWWMTEDWVQSRQYYSWEQARSACPPGWRLPCEQEIKHLIGGGVYGSSNAAFTMLNSSDRNNCQFNVYYAGFKTNENSPPLEAGKTARYWCKTEHDDLSAWSFSIDWQEKEVMINERTRKVLKLRCRCVQPGKDYYKSSLSQYPCAGN